MTHGDPIPKPVTPEGQQFVPEDAPDADILNHEDAPEIVELEYDPSSLAVIPRHRLDEIGHMVDDLRNKGYEEKDIQFNLYSELESLGVDLSRAVDDQVVIEYVDNDGMHETLAIRIDNEDFGTTIRRANLKPITSGETNAERDSDQDERLEVLKGYVQSRITEVVGIASLEGKEATFETDLRDFKESTELLTRRLYQEDLPDRGVIDEFRSKVNEILQVVMDTQRTRAEQMRAINGQTEGSEDLLPSVNRTFDDAHVATARQRVESLAEGIVNVKNKFAYTLASVGNIRNSIYAVANTIDELQSNRFGRDQAAIELRETLLQLTHYMDADAVAKSSLNGALEILTANH